VKLSRKVWIVVCENRSTGERLEATSPFSRGFSAGPDGMVIGGKPVKKGDKGPGWRVVAIPESGRRADG